MAASLGMFRRQQFPREAQQIRIAARPSTSLRIVRDTSPVGFARHAGRSSRPSAVSVRKGGRALDGKRAPVLRNDARPDRSASIGAGSARTFPRTALLTRVRAQSRRCWFNFLATARPRPKNTAHSPSRPRHACAHLPLEFRWLPAEAGRDVNERTNRPVFRAWHNRYVWY